MPKGYQANCKHWTKNETLLLIAAFSDLKEEFMKTKQKKVWKLITKRLIDSNVEVSLEQCISKWKSLVKTYRKIREANRVVGDGRTRFEYFAEMDVHKDIILAPTVQSSQNSPIVIEMPQWNDTTMEDVFVVHNYSLITKSSKRKHDFTFFKDYFTERRKWDDKMRKLESQRHDERLGLEMQKLEVLQDILEKLD